MSNQINIKFFKVRIFSSTRLKTQDLKIFFFLSPPDDLSLPNFSLLTAAPARPTRRVWIDCVCWTIWALRAHHTPGLRIRVEWTRNGISGRPRARVPLWTKSSAELCREATAASISSGWATVEAALLGKIARLCAELCRARPVMRLIAAAGIISGRDLERNPRAIRAIH